MSIIRSFARRFGKTMGVSKKNLIETVFPSYDISKLNTIKKIKNRELILEIGFGDGKHLFHKIKNNPDKFFIGCEPFVNGVANLLKLNENEKHRNFLVFKDDVNLMLNHFSALKFTEIYILFPDPWPKKKHKKRRLFNFEFLKLLSQHMNNGTKLFFASDDKNYATRVFDVFIKNRNFALKNTTLKAYREPFYTDFKTKYEQRALRLGNECFYITATYLGDSI